MDGPVILVLILVLDIDIDIDIGWDYFNCWHGKTSGLNFLHNNNNNKNNKNKRTLL